MSTEGHLEELKIALDPSDPRRVVPTGIPEGAHVLDVGCGAGQTLIAACQQGRTFGLDISFAALALGKTLTDKVIFVCGAAENLPFRNCSFDFVIARVSLPYTNIPVSVREIRRVLRPQGQLWAVFERISLPFQIGLYKNPGFWLLLPYLWLNTLLFHTWGKSIPFIDGKYHGYQTVTGISRVLQKAGFIGISVTKGLHLVVTAHRD